MRRENRRRDNRNARQLHRVWKSALGAALAAALILGGLDTGSYSTLIRVEAAGDSQGQLKTVYLDGSGSDGDGTTRETAVNSFSKAVNLAAEGATVLVCGTVNITGESQLSMPSGITVKKAEGFTGPVVKVTGQGKLRITYGWLNSADVDVSEADLGQDAFVIGEEKKEEPKEEAKEEPTEEPKDETKTEPEEEPDVKQPAQEVVVPGSLTMAEPVSLSSLDMGEGFSGDGTFRFAEPDKVPDTYESSQQVIFTPNDCENFDYSQTDGWSPEGQEVVRYVTIYVESLKEPEPPAEQEEEPEAPKEDNTAQEPSVQEPETEQPETEQPEKEQPETPEEENTEKQPGKESEAEEEKPDEDKTAVDNKEDNDKDNNKEDVNNEVKEDEGKKAETEKKDEENKPSESEKEPVGSLVDKASGIEVSGDFIPSYVEIRVTKNEAAQDIPDNRIEKVLNSYDIELWNLKTDSKYKIPDGKKVTVKIPVPGDAELFGTLIIAHYKPDKGEYEYFVPNQNLMIEDGYLIFETDSFSPFNVGGGNQLVGIGTTSPNHKPSGGSSTGSSGTRTPGSGSSLLGNNSGSSSPVIKRPTITSSGNSGSRTTVVNPRTGDETPILTYVLIAAAAVIIIIILLVLGKKKKK